LYELHSLDKKKREKNEALRQKNIKKEEAKCTFHPKISKGSQMIANRPQTAMNSNKRNLRNDRSHSPSVFDKLYDDSKKNQPKEKTRQEVEYEKYLAECTFRPNIK